MTSAPERLIITIDGPAGAGKSTLAKKLAEILDWTYLDTGAMYRAVAVAADEKGIKADDEKGLNDLVRSLDLQVQADQQGTRVFLNGRDITQKIRVHHISALASRVSAFPVVREAMVELQQRLGEKGRVVAEGRDMGTVVFPGAKVKFYLDASVEERGRRRHEELKRLGPSASLEEITRDIARRDENDTTRAASPLQQAPDAMKIDSTRLGPEAVLERMIDAAVKKIGMKLKRKY